MNRTAFLSLCSLSALFLAAFVSPVLAESRTTVNVQSNTGENTVCVNGTCTTSSEGTSNSKVCVNGQCWDSTDGDVNYKSQDGNTNVNISNNTKSVEVQQNGDEGVVVKKGQPTITPTLFKNEVKKEVQGVKDELDAKKQEAEKKIEEAKKEFNILSFIQTELEEIKKFFTLEFIFGKK